MNEDKIDAPHAEVEAREAEKQAQEAVENAREESRKIRNMLEDSVTESGKGKSSENGLNE